jgi:hypothetical protein
MGAFTIFDPSKGDVLLPLFTKAGAPSDGTSGTYANVAIIGALLLDVTNGEFYQNRGTKASPTWTALTTATGAGTYTGTFDGLLGSDTPAAAVVTTLSASGVVSMLDRATGLTAIGTDRAGSLALTKQFNNVTTVGASTAGVTLPAASIGAPIYVWNNGANSMHVYGAGTDTIDGVAAATGVELANAKSAIFYPIASGAYVSMMGVKSA